MALFGRKKPAELLAEAMKLTDLIMDWLRQPLEAVASLGVSDRVTAEYYTLAVCSYLAQEKISPAAREYLHEAVVRSSTYGKKYSKDLRKDCSFMAVLLNQMKTKEREARRGKKNVLQAVVEGAFSDFRQFDQAGKVRRAVCDTVNLFVREIETTDYTGMRIPVAEPARPAACAPSPRTAPAPEPPKADYTFQSVDGGMLYFDRDGDPWYHNSRLYQPLKQQGTGMVLFLESDTGAIVRDTKVISELMDAYRKRLANRRPTQVTLSNDKGQTQTRKVMGWMEFRGKEYAITTDLGGKKTIMVLVRGEDGHLTGVDSATGNTIFGLFRDRHPAMFK